MSTIETLTQLQNHQQLGLEEETVKLRVVVTRQKDNPILGIGITTTDDNQESMIGWTLRERSSGSQIVDEALALKLTISKATTFQQRKVQFQV